MYKLSILNHTTLLLNNAHSIFTLHFPMKYINWHILILQFIITYITFFELFL